MTTSTSPRHQTGQYGILRDLADGLAMSEVWRTFAWSEIQNRYQRSMIGMAWIAFSYLLFVFAIVIFFRGFSPTSDQIFIAHVALGYAAFTFLISTLSQGCNVFKSSATWIKSVNLPHSIYVFKSIAGALVPFFINFTLAIIIMISFGLRFEPSAILFVPALGLYLLNAISIQYLFGLIAARWPDFQHLIAAVTRLFFFITPILWVYEDMSGRRKLLADLNPFTHFVDIFRAPLLGQPYIENSWLISLGWTLAGWLAAIIVANAMRRRLPFWV